MRADYSPHREVCQCFLPNSTICYVVISMFALITFKKSPHWVLSPKFWPCYTFSKSLMKEINGVKEGQGLQCRIRLPVPPWEISSEAETEKKEYVKIIRLTQENKRVFPGGGTT